MKPLLVIPPAPARWPVLQALPIHDDRLWQEDLEKRFAHGVTGSQDAFAIIPDGGHIRACAAISKRHDLGVLTRVFTQPEYRGGGLAGRLVQTLVGWFEMTGGKWLYANTTADIAERFLRKLGFVTLRRAARTPFDAVVLVRAAGGVPVDPLATAAGRVSIHDVTRANWPSLASLLYNRPGPDPRISLDESAVAADSTTLELLSRHEAGTCHLKAAFHGNRLVGLATVATDLLGQRTYAMVMPHSGAPPGLREAIVEFARTKGYEQVDFPLDALAGSAETGAALGVSSAPPDAPILPAESGVAPGGEQSAELPPTDSLPEQRVPTFPGEPT